MHKIPLFSLLLVAANSFSLYNLVNIPLKTGAACLDGSQFGFYLWEPEELDPHPNKLLIYFQ